jgi:hypothetical protein
MLTTLLAIGIGGVDVFPRSGLRRTAPPMAARKLGEARYVSACATAHPWKDWAES